jgi:hypothetical protein
MGRESVLSRNERKNKHMTWAGMEEVSTKYMVRVYSLLAHTKDRLFHVGDATIGGPEKARGLFCRLVVLLPL